MTSSSTIDRPFPDIPRQSRGGSAKLGPNSPIQPGWLHLGVVREAYNVLHDLGASPGRTISETGLDPSLFEDGNNLVPFVSIGHMMTHCARYTECDHFGMMIGARAGVESLGLIGAVMQNSATVGAAIAALVAHLGIQNRAAVPYLEVFDEIALFSFLPYKRGMVGAGLYAEGGVATTVSVFRDLAGAEWSPQEVLLPREAPSRLEPYWRFFRAPVRFNQELATLVFPASFLETEFPGADPDVLRDLMAQVRFLEANSDRSVSDRLRRLIRQQLIHARCSVDSIAHSLDMNRRTLNRRLAAEGTTMRGLLAEMRFEVACQLIADTNLELSAVSAALDFSEPAAFNHAFRRLAGCPPSEWRRTRVERQLAGDRPTRAGASDN